MSREWSPQQSAIFDWFRCSEGNLVVRARAGTGKTTTILEGISCASETRILLVAFNKTIATELQQKLRNPRAEAKTLHGLGFSFITRNWQRVTVDNERSERLAKEACDEDTPHETVAAVRKLASLAKNCTPDLRFEDVIELAYEYDVFPDDAEESLEWDCEYIVTSAITAAKLALEEDGTVDFDDMLFVPVMKNWVRARWDLVVVDEAQDMNATQLRLACAACKGRLVVVGDDRQAIYGFRGADSGAIDRLKLELKAKELGLTITYRCPRRIVHYARSLVPDYQAAPACAEGVIRHIDAVKLTGEAQVGDFILSRKNAPLVGACLSLLRAGKPAKIAGADVSRQLLTLINKFRHDSMTRMLEKLTRWEEKHIERAQKLPEKKIAAKVQSIQDIAATIRALSDGCAGVGELRSRIESMFIDEARNPNEVVVLSSIHKAKGQERNRVFLYEDTLYPGGKRDDVEEQNLEYVAVTRAKQELIFVRGT